MSKSLKKKQLRGSARPSLPKAKRVEPTSPHDVVTVTLIVRRRPDGPPPRDADYFHRTPPSARAILSHGDFEAVHGASQADLETVEEFARAQKMTVVGSHKGRRSVVISGTVAQMNSAFAVNLHNYDSTHGKYRGYTGPVSLPVKLSEIVESVIGLDNRPLPVRHSTADPASTSSLTPGKVAQLYNFPSGDGSGQTIGIYEMVTSAGSPGYTSTDLALTMSAFGGSLTAPTPTDVSIDGQANAKVSDSETVLDITVASAIAQKANIAVYFTDNSVQGILHALQTMIHPGNADPVPTVISISYAWSPDDDNTSLSDDDYAQLSELFGDAINLGITVLASTGDTGAQYTDATQAQAAYPATDPSVLACGGTTVGNISTMPPGFDEYVWNDTWMTSTGTDSGATGGGVSARFPLPGYQNGAGVPTRVNKGTSGRGIPDVSGNASPNSGYAQFLGGKSQGAIGGTSAVAPLYAGLVAIINSLLAAAGALYSAGFLNPTIYSMGSKVCRDVTGTSGPTNNTYGGVTGYSASTGWDACTGWGSINGNELLNAIRPLSAAVQILKHGDCDPGPIAGNIITLFANTVGGVGQLSYQWTPVNAQVAPGSSTTAASIEILVPSAGTAFTLSVEVTNQFGADSKASATFLSVDPELAAVSQTLCEFLHWSMQFRIPIFINPGDPGPYYPFTPIEIQNLYNFSTLLSNLSGAVLQAGLLPQNSTLTAERLKNKLNKDI